MPVTQAMNPKANVKKFTNNDLPFSPQQPVMSSFYAVSTAGQTVINLSFSVDQTLTDQFFLFVDGKKLRLGASNDYTFTSIGSDNRSSQVTLTAAIPIDLNIQAYQLGLKSELEFGTDNRFTQLYEAMDAGFQGFVPTNVLVNATITPGSPVAGTFYSSVIGRAPILDLGADLGVRMGSNRIHIQSMALAPSEFGPAGEPVYSQKGEGSSLIRFVGYNWTVLSGVNGSAPTVPSGSATGNEFLEFTFYGTGANLLLALGGFSTLDLRVQVDGGTEGANIAPPATASGVITNRQYMNYVQIPMATGLALGIHTIRLRIAAATGIGVQVGGVEALTENTNIVVNPGTAITQGKKYIAAAQQTFSPSTSVTGTRGGRMVAYISGDGVVGRSFTPVNATQANLNAADHTNEEVIRTHYFREFAANRSDDFFANGTNAVRTFTLDDGVTSLYANQVDIGIFSGRDALRLGTTGAYVLFTFVGTGLDIIRVDENVSADSLSVSVDGVSVGALTTTGVIGDRQLKIVSGLPYGTHLVRITQSISGAGRSYINKFIVYGPKKPSVPSGSVEIADYNVVANFAANTTAGFDTIATGVIRKDIAFREALYVNGTGGTSDWAIDTPGKRTTTDRLNAYVETVFFGTGVEIRCQAQSNGTANQVITLNGLAANTTNFPTMVSSAYGTGVTFNPATGVADFQDAATTGGAGVRISGLPLARYVIRMNNGTAGSFIRGEQIDVITPVHSYKNVTSATQNTLFVGSQGIGDTRKHTPVKEALPVSKVYAQAIGTINNPTTSSTAYVPMPEMFVTVKTNGGPLEISYNVSTYSNTAQAPTFTRVFINGVPVGNEKAVNQPSALFDTMNSDNIIVPLDAGTYTVAVYWRTTTGTLTADEFRRTLTVKEL